MVHFAGLCADNGVEYLSLACEQPGQTDAAQYAKWVDLAKTVRAAEPGVKLTAAFTTLELYLLHTYWLPQAPRTWRSCSTCSASTPGSA